MRRGRPVEWSNDALRALWLRLFIWRWSWQRMRGGRSLLGLLQAPAWQLWQGYRREVDTLNAWVRRMRRSAEAMALSDWRSCRSPEEWEAAKRRWGRILETARAKWYQTDDYKRRKAQRKKGLS